MTMFFLSFFALAAGAESSTTTEEPQCVPSACRKFGDKVGVINANCCAPPNQGSCATGYEKSEQGAPEECGVGEEKTCCTKNNTAIQPMNRDEPDDEAQNRCADPCKEAGVYDAELTDGTQGQPGRGYCKCSDENPDGVYVPIHGDYERVCADNEDSEDDSKEVATDECQNWETKRIDNNSHLYAACHNANKDHCADEYCFLLEGEAATTNGCSYERDNIIGNTHKCRCRLRTGCTKKTTDDDFTYECDAAADLRRRSLRA